MGKITINQDSLKERREWKRHKVNEGSNIFRILPPFGEDSAHNGYPYRKWSYIWLADPVTGKRKPFASPFSSGEDACPVKEYADALVVKVDGIIDGLKAKGQSKDQINKNPRIQKIREIQWKLKLTHGYLYNACDKSGEVGILELKATAHKDMMKRMSDYIKERAEDPTSLQSYEDDSGVWFDIRRDGVGKNTEYSVAFNQETIKHAELGLVKKDDRSPLPDNVIENYEDLGYDLSSMYTIKTYAELKEILVANLTALATDRTNPIPDLIVDGFNEDGVVSTYLEEEILQEEPIKKKVAAKKKAVTLKIDKVEEEESVATSTEEISDDFFAMADDILKD